MKHGGSLLFLFFLFSPLLFAQTASEMDILLQTDAVRAASAARFVLDSAGRLPLGLSGDAAEKAAFETAREQGWLKQDDAGQISLKETAFLVMNAFEIKGGVLYALFHNPRYAYRELRYRNIIQGRSDPDFTVSGHRLLQIIARAADYAQKTKPISRSDPGASGQQGGYSPENIFRYGDDAETRRKGDEAK